MSDSRRRFFFIVLSVEKILCEYFVFSSEYGRVVDINSSLIPSGLVTII